MSLLQTCRSLNLVYYGRLINTSAICQLGWAPDPWRDKWLRQQVDNFLCVMYKIQLSLMQISSEKKTTKLKISKLKCSVQILALVLQSFFVTLSFYLISDGKLFFLNPVFILRILHVLLYYLCWICWSKATIYKVIKTSNISTTNIHVNANVISVLLCPILVLRITYLCW